MLTALLAMLRELIPFFKESILQGRSFPVWLKSNVFTFAWLLTALLMILVTAHQADIIVKIRQRENGHVQQLEQMHEPLTQILALYQKKDAENKELKSQLEELLKMHDEVVASNEDYKRWIDKCGIAYRPNGQCPVPRRVVVRGKAPATPQPAQVPVPQEEPKTGFLQRIRNIFKHKKDES